MAKEEPLAEFIQRVVASGLLNKQLVFVPQAGARDSDLTAASLPEALRELLAWKNGLNLDVVRIHGVGKIERGIRPITANNDGEIGFASDPAGFQYLLGRDGSVTSIDHDGGATEHVAGDVQTFLRVFVFGSRAAEFGGNEWAQEVAELLGAT